MPVRVADFIVVSAVVFALLSCENEVATLEPNIDTRMEWYFKETDGCFGASAPAVGEDGTIYLGANANFGFLGDKSILAMYAINPDGTLKWKYMVGANVYTPAIGDDGTIYFQDEFNKLYALTPDGTLKWVTAGGYGDASKSPAIGIDGTIYCTIGTYFYAIDPDGNERWSYPMHIENRSSPSIGMDGTIYIGTSNQASFYAFDPDGTVKWEHVFSNAFWIYSTPAIDADGTVYLGVEQGEGFGDSSWVYAFNPDGSVKWMYTFTGSRDIRSSPVIGSDGTIYIGSSGYCDQTGGFVALNPDGTLKWEYAITNSICYDDPDHIYFTAAIGNDEVIYLGAGNTSAFATGENLITAINSDGVVLWEWNPGESHGGYGSGFAASPVVKDSLVYVALFDWSAENGMIGDGILYALHSSSNGMTNSPWPKFRHDLRNTGRAGF